ncbi:MAG: hypothetical protein ACK5AZ_20745 [Bryobacteraceae bacterium]
MLKNFRHFQVADPFGRTWDVEFRWQQNAISIRHSDSVDVKFFLAHEDTRLERVIALMHKDLVAVSDRAGRPVTDPWCMKLAALHLEKMISTWEDMDKTIVTVSPAELEEYNSELEQAAQVEPHV